MKLIFITSTNGGVLRKLLEHKIVRDCTSYIVSDRECGALNVAKEKKIAFEKLESSDGLSFSVKLNDRFNENDFIFISFYTKLFTKEFLDSRKGKIFNCHPSILPACKGLNGFEDTLSSNSLFIGCTLHEVNSSMDDGRSVIQCAYPLDRQADIVENRHKVFLMQYYSTLQFIKWINEKKFKNHKNWYIENPVYRESAFSPNLDEDFFTYFKIPNEL